MKNKSTLRCRNKQIIINSLNRIPKQDDSLTKITLLGLVGMGILGFATISLEGMKANASDLELSLKSKDSKESVTTKITTSPFKPLPKDVTASIILPFGMLNPNLKIKLQENNISEEELDLYKKNHLNLNNLPKPFTSSQISEVLKIKTNSQKTSNYANKNIDLENTTLSSTNNKKENILTPKNKNN